MLIAALLPGCASASEPDDDNYSTGLLPSSPDELKSLPVVPSYTDAVPGRVDLSAHLPPIGDQGKVGACVAWATGYAARSLYVSWLEGRDVTQPQNVPSPEFIYDSINKRPGDCGGGSDIATGAKFLEEGAPSLADAPYSDAAMLSSKCVRPSAEEGQLKRDFFVETSYFIDSTDVDSIKGELAQGHPVVVAIKPGHSFQNLAGPVVYQGEWKGYYSQAYRANVPSRQQLGGHAIAIIGYDDSKKAFKVMNSWGTSWGERGFGWISYEAASDPDIMTEAISLRPGRPH
jgi:C1A family cysteine protease